MRWTVVAVGRLKNGPERDLVERYRQRIGGTGRALSLTGLDIVELPESRARRDADRRAEEGTELLGKAGNAALVVFDERGKNLSSDSFAQHIQQWREAGRQDMVYVIGGPDGLDPRVRQQADLVVSFGALTLPHQIVRALVAEQLYRALTIMTGHPYHRAGHGGS